MSLLSATVGRDKAKLLLQLAKDRSNWLMWKRRTQLRRDRAEQMRLAAENAAY